jgi:hypothetical protein
MPCACKLPLEIYPDAVEWGPILWKLLHGLSEKSGRPLTPLYAEEERRAWLTFFKQTGDIIPCSACKEHFEMYLKEHPVDELKHMNLQNIHDWIRRWFWELHEWVNDTLKKPSFPFENLTPTYGAVNLRITLKQFEMPMKKAIEISGYNNKKFIDWKSKYIRMLSLYGV